LRARISASTHRYMALPRLPLWMKSIYCLARSSSEVCFKTAWSTVLMPFPLSMSWRVVALERRRVPLHSRCQATQNGFAEPFHRGHRVLRRTTNSRPQGRKLAFFVSGGEGNACQQLLGWAAKPSASSHVEICAGLFSPAYAPIRRHSDSVTHRATALPAVTGEHYEGGHWLGTFAVYLTSQAGTEK
jgi:hypothetical protein